MQSSFVSDVSMSSWSASFHFDLQSLNNSMDFNWSAIFEPDSSIFKGPLSTADEITQHSDRPKTAQPRFQNMHGKSWEQMEDISIELWKHSSELPPKPNKD